MPPPRKTHSKPATQLTRKKLRVLLPQARFQLFHCWLQQGLNIPLPKHGNYFHMGYAKMEEFCFYVVPGMEHYKVGVRVHNNGITYLPNICLFPVSVDVDLEEEWEEEFILSVLLGDDLDPSVVISTLTPEGEEIGIIPLEDPLLSDLKAIVAKMNEVGKAFMETFMEAENMSSATLMESLKVPAADPARDYTQADKA